MGKWEEFKEKWEKAEGWDGYGYVVSEVEEVLLRRSIHFQEIRDVVVTEVIFSSLESNDGEVAMIIRDLVDFDDPCPTISGHGSEVYAYIGKRTTDGCWVDIIEIGSYGTTDYIWVKYRF